MGKSIFEEQGFFVGLMISGLLVLPVVGVVLSAGASGSLAQAAYRVAPWPMAPQPDLEPHEDDDDDGKRGLPGGAWSAARSKSALIPTLPPITIPAIETLIPDTTALPLPTGELPGLPTVPPVLSTPVPEPSATPTPTSTATPDESDAEGPGRRLKLLVGLGLAGLCVVALLIGGGLLFLLRRRGRRPARGDGSAELAEVAAPSPGSEGNAMLIVPGIDPIVLRSGVTTIGRSEENDIIIEDHQVSRHHARIECAESVCTVEDLQSSNGTFVNGERVSRSVLTAGDRLRIGDAEMTYRLPEGWAPDVWLEIDGERYPVPASGLTVGRSGENEVRLADPLASRKHVRIAPRQGTQVLIDLDSANGTFVNGQRIREHVLRHGDEIRIGSSRITFHGRTGR